MQPVFLDVAMGPTMGDLGLEDPTSVILLLVAELVIASLIVIGFVLRKHGTDQKDKKSDPANTEQEDENA